MRLLLASSEVHPFSKTGGLADMVIALAKALAADGHDVIVVTPLYRGISEKFGPFKRLDYQLDLILGDQSVAGNVQTFEMAPRLDVYFIDQPVFFDRASLYQQDGNDYIDNAERFVFFSKAVAHLARYLPNPPQLVHVHDWQAGLVPLFIKDQKKNAGWTAAPASCLTIHNLAYQGFFDADDFALTNLPTEYFRPDGVEFYKGLNCLKAAILYSDMLTTVSPRYAREITTELLGCGLDGVLRNRQDALVGILNGVDYGEWNTTDNKFLRQTYSIDNLEGKAADKAALQTELGLPVDHSVPVFGSVTRLAEQKGVDIQLGALEEMLSTGLQFVLLGSGAPVYEAAYRRLARRLPSRAAIRIGYDHGLAHRIEAGSDFFLMPSRFEPCGLNQMYSLRYGTIPIVRVTGGLDDSVIDLAENADEANGIKFQDYSTRALTKAIRKALIIYADPELHRHLQLNGMAANFSWETTCKQYEEVYLRALERNRTLP
jgi:starch synthase